MGFIILLAFVLFFWGIGKLLASFIPSDEDQSSSSSFITHHHHHHYDIKQENHLHVDKTTFARFNKK
jgi:hypothetical protein